jgi:hypothetical protein
MFGRPERLTLLIAGLVAPAPYNTALFLVAGVLCLVSAIQAITSGVSRKSLKTPIAGGYRQTFKNE